MSVTEIHFRATNIPRTLVFVLVEDPTFREKILLTGESCFNRLGSLTITVNKCLKMYLLVQFYLTISSDSFLKPCEL
jgi:hypothetical protein